MAPKLHCIYSIKKAVISFIVPIILLLNLLCYLEVNCIYCSCMVLDCSHTNKLLHHFTIDIVSFLCVLPVVLQDR